MVDLGQKKVNASLPFFMRQSEGLNFTSEFKISL